MPKTGTDKRRAEWTLKPDIVSVIEGCFKNTAVLVVAVDTNSNTWKKIFDGEHVKKSVAKEIADTFLSFIEDFANDKVPADSSKYYDKKIVAAAKKLGDSEADDLLIRKVD